MKRTDHQFVRPARLLLVAPIIPRASDVSGDGRRLLFALLCATVRVWTTACVQPLNGSSWARVRHDPSQQPHHTHLDVESDLQLEDE